MTRLLISGLCLLNWGACHGVDALAGSAQSISVVALANDVHAAPGESAEIVVQAQDGDGNGVDGVQVFFLVSDTSVVSFSEQPSTDLIYVETRNQDAMGFKAAGLATTKVVAAQDSAGKSAKVVTGLSSPSDTTQKDSVRVVLVTVDDPNEINDRDGGYE